MLKNSIIVQLPDDVTSTEKKTRNLSTAQVIQSRMIIEKATSTQISFQNIINFLHWQTRDQLTQTHLKYIFTQSVTL